MVDREAELQCIVAVHWRTKHRSGRIQGAAGNAFDLKVVAPVVRSRSSAGQHLDPKIACRDNPRAGDCIGRICADRVALKSIVAEYHRVGICVDAGNIGFCFVALAIASAARAAVDCPVATFFTVPVFAAAAFAMSSSPIERTETTFGSP